MSRNVSKSEKISARERSPLKLRKSVDKRLERLYNSGLIGMEYIYSFLPIVQEEGVEKFKKAKYTISPLSDNVMMATRKNDNKTMLIKRIKKKDAEMICEFPKEYLINRSLNHPHISSFSSIEEDDKYFYMFGDYHKDGSLYDLLDRIDDGDYPSSYTLFKNLARQLISALDYCNKRGIIHSDIKPENIVMDLNYDDSQAYLIDFGYSVVQDPEDLVYVYHGSVHYAAPELFTATPHNGIKSDIWSLGVTFYVMYFGEVPFNDEDRVKLTELIINSEPDYPRKMEKAEQPCLKVIRKMLSKDPNKRPTLESILNSGCLK